MNIRQIEAGVWSVVLSSEHEKEEVLRCVFRKARRVAKEELARQLNEFQVKRQVGLGTLYGPDDSVLMRCDLDKAQVEPPHVFCSRRNSSRSSDIGR